MTPERVVRRAEKDRERLNGVNAVSAFSAPSLTAGEIAAAGDIPHRVLMVSKVGRVRAAGFEVRRTGIWPHCSIVFTEECNTETAQRLIDVFEEQQA